MLRGFHVQLRRRRLVVGVVALCIAYAMLVASTGATAPIWCGVG
jgi:hypothetical protein